MNSRSETISLIIIGLIIRSVNFLSANPDKLVSRGDIPY